MREGEVRVPQGAQWSDGLASFFFRNALRDMGNENARKMAICCMERPRLVLMEHS
jgi:hypothetical protein